LAFILPILSVFLILLILVQRGRGGGLVGAFGGMGGQSAFGAKAGDLFTKITVVTVCIWIAICVGLLLLMKQGGTVPSSVFGGGRTSEPAATVPADSNAPVTVPVPAESP
jgi:preprotein translocase subunit SecG